MPSLASAKVKQESAKLRRLVAEYVNLRHSKRPSAARLAALRRQIKDSLLYLDRHGLRLGDDKAAVEGLLGPPPGRAGEDSWFYPGGEAQESYRLDFRAGNLARKSFDIILTG